MKAGNVPAVSSSLSILADGGGEKLVMFLTDECEIITLECEKEVHHRGSLVKASTLMSRN